MENNTHIYHTMVQYNICFQLQRNNLCGETSSTVIVSLKPLKYKCHKHEILNIYSVTTALWQHQCCILRHQCKYKYFYRFLSVLRQCCNNAVVTLYTTYYICIYKYQYHFSTVIILQQLCAYCFLGAKAPTPCLVSLW